MAEFVQRDFLDPDVLRRLGNLPLFARSPMMGNVAGRHQSPHRGSSVEFAEYRKYVPGDDIRRLDWRAWGRSDRYYIKEFEADTNLRLNLVVDTSGSMKYGSGETSKLDYARRIAGTLGFIALKQGDAVGLTLAAGKRILDLPPKRKPSHLSLVNDALAQAQPQGETGLAEVLHEVAERVRQRALVVVISDFFIEPDQLQGCFQHLRFRKHDVAAFQLFDPQELDFNFDKPTRFVDLEGGEDLITEPFVIADRYKTALSNYMEKLKRVVSDAAVDFHRVTIDTPYEQILASFLLGRAARKKGRR